MNQILLTGARNLVNRLKWQTRLPPLYPVHFYVDDLLYRLDECPQVASLPPFFSTLSSASKVACTFLTGFVAQRGVKRLSIVNSGFNIAIASLSQQAYTKHASSNASHRVIHKTAWAKTGATHCQTLLHQGTLDAARYVYHHVVVDIG